MVLAGMRQQHPDSVMWLLTNKYSLNKQANSGGVFTHSWDAMGCAIMLFSLASLCLSIWICLLCCSHSLCLLFTVLCTAESQQYSFQQCHW